MKHGTLILVSGPSGSGKGTLIAGIRERFTDIVFPISATTRKPRVGEVDGVAYHFLSKKTFEQKIADGAFLEWAEYGGQYYGTLKSEVLDPLADGKTVLNELEVQGVQQIQEQVSADQLVLIFIDGGSWEELKARIEERAPMSDDELARRHARYIEEVRFKESADYVVRNPHGKADEATEELARIIEEIRTR